MDLGKSIGLAAIQPSLDTVYYFENLEHTKKANPHYHIALPTINGNYVLLVMFTSQIDRKEEYYSLTNQNALSSLVYADKDKFCFLTKDSVIDCNHPIYKTKEELGAIISSLEYREADLTETFINDIKDAILTSPIARRNIKKALK